jgi:hypothetical protein
MTKLERFTTKVTTQDLLSDFGLRRSDFYVKSADAIMTPAAPAPVTAEPAAPPDSARAQAAPTRRESVASTNGGETPAANGLTHP